MNMKKLLRTMTMAAGVAIGTAASAAGANGDIFEFRPCDQYGANMSAGWTWATAESPLASGETVYFKMRLVQGTYRDADTTWRLVHTGDTSEIIDDALYPLQIGVYVSGELRWADLAEYTVDEATGITDFVFKYVTKAGDFGMPVVLATEDGPASTSNGSSTYLLNSRGGKWSIANNNGVSANLWFWTVDRPSPTGDDPIQDYSLSQCGIYIKTLDFDASWESGSAADYALDGSGVWRSVHENSTITVGPAPSIIAKAAPENAVTLHVWSTDDTAVTINGGHAETITVYEGGTAVQKQIVVGDIKFVGGQLVPTYFEIKGVAEGKSAQLVLSPWIGYNYDAAKQQIVDYVTVPVACLEPMPATIIVDVDRETAYAEVGDGWKTAGAELDVYLSQALETDIDVTITPGIVGHDELDMAEYVRFSKVNPSVKTISQLADKVTVTIKAGQLRSTENPKVYAYFLRGDDYTSGGNTLDFTPSIPDDQKTATGMTTADRFSPGAVEVVARMPVIVSPGDSSELGATAGVPQEIEIEIDDTYAGEHIASGDGYTIEVKYNDASGWRAIEGVYYVGQGSLLRTAAGALPEITFPTSSASSSTGTFNTQIRVTEPINGNRPVVKIISTVASPKTVSVISDKDVYNEGDNATFTIQLNSNNDTGAPLYAFLVAGPDDATAGMFSALGRKCVITPDMEADDTTWPLTSGIAINPDNGGPESPVKATVKLLDGASEDIGGSSFYFQVVLSETPAYPGRAGAVTGYNSNFSTIQVFNVEPTITRVEKDGNEPNEDTGYFDGAYPVGQEQTFQAIVKDAGGFDLTSGFQTRWSIVRTGGGATVPVEVIEGNPNDAANVKKVTFNQAGTYRIRVQVKDKDMEDWAAAYNESYITIVDQPQLTIEFNDTPNETSSSETVTFGLGGYYNSTDPMIMMVTVTPPSLTSPNPGVLKLDDSYMSVPAGYEALAEAAIAAEGSETSDHYYLSFRGLETIALAVLEMDGTRYTLNPGFTIKAQILNDGNSPAEGKKWSAYYLTRSKRFRINNVDPVCIVTDRTNVVEVAGGAATSYPIRWSIRSDVDNDYAGLWEDGATQGIKVSFSGCANADDGLTYVTDPTMGASGVFIPNFGSVQGVQTVTIMIEDKDGGLVTTDYKYKVTASKFLEMIPVGPGNTSTAGRYDGAPGIGQGHGWAAATFSDAQRWIYRWNCGGQLGVRIFGHGYRYDETGNTRDDGTLDAPYDIAVDTAGNAPAGVTIGWANAYNYSASNTRGGGADGKDSFLYAFMVKGASEDGKSSAPALLGDTYQVETPVDGAPRSATVELPAEEAQNGGYAVTEAALVFSKELFAEDNLGDINADAVPDYYAVMYKWGIGATLVEAAVGDLLTGDMVDLGVGNPDEDYLPGAYAPRGDEALYDGAQTSYAPIGPAFTTRWEIRGFHDGLNALDQTRSDASFSADEAAAYKAYFLARNGAEWTDADGYDLAFWSPEPKGEKPRMDPTMADTDGDRFPDGWEYFFWYQAHVWGPAGSNIGRARHGQHYIFERFDFDNITSGIEIPFADVEARFNPCSSNAKAVQDNPDFDRDGLSDIEELAIGTNPCHWDTDGDSMCDGWEVMNAIDPLNGTTTLTNPDGDFMAYATLERSLMMYTPNDENYGLLNPVNAGVVVTVFPDLEFGVDFFDTTVQRDIKGAKGFSFYVKFKTEPVATGRYDEENNEIFDDVATEPYYYGGDVVLPYKTDMPGDWIWGKAMVDGIQRVTVDLPAGTVLHLGADIVLVHDQVMSAYGFDPRTGWSNKNGYVSDRWNPSINQNIPDISTGEAVNTRPYYSTDEYLVMQYMRDYGIIYNNADIDGRFDYDDVWGTIRMKTTNPNVIGYTSGEGEVGDAEAQATDASAALAAALTQSGSGKTIRSGHGADTDGDGVPDGWELYTRRNPLVVPQSPFEDVNRGGVAQTLDADTDGLNYVREFAGVDSCNAYENCEAVFANHPGNASGWFNKFFPTNPDSADTDADGLADGSEGGGWADDFYNAGHVYPAVQVRLTFNYGEKTDDGRTVCFRGGGMNPCTIDTDLDGLPDPWEKQHAGAVVKLPERTVLTPGIELDEATFAADGVLNTQAAAQDGETAAAEDAETETGSGYYITAGMDATWPYDVCSDAIKDPVTGTYRDVDFDHDGLQNYQEYMVQAMRHFRYDDTTTPLMGRLFEEGEYDAAGNVTTQHRQEFGTTISPDAGTGYPVFDAADPETFAANAVEAWYGKEFVQYVTVTTGVQVTSRVVDLVTGETETVTNYFTARRKVIDPASGEMVVNNHIANAGTRYQRAWNEAGWRAIGYFARPLMPYDRALTSNRLSQPASFMLPVANGLYVSTDPRMCDTDQDGMDDYYELFHGLNPILGTSPTKLNGLGYALSNWAAANDSRGKFGDIISAVYSGGNLVKMAMYNAFYNEWVYPTFSRALALDGLVPCQFEPVAPPMAFDAVMYPWANGGAQADPDGDGLRNDEERALASVADPLPRHTDPTPLWFTERTTPLSYVAQYYKTPPYIVNMPWRALRTEDYGSAALQGNSNFEYMFCFEENEGYDTDGDMLSDGQEVVSAFRAGSDPLKFDDPSRRQALYLDGNDSYAMSKESIYRPIDAVDFLKQFTVEVWAMPEDVSREQTIVERSTLVYGNSINKDALAIRANFRIGLDEMGRVYGLFDNTDAKESGIDAPTSCQKIVGPVLKTGEWRHFALTFDGEWLVLYVDAKEVARERTSLIPANGVTEIGQYVGGKDTMTSTGYLMRPSAIFLGARPKAKSDHALNVYEVEVDETTGEETHYESFENMREWFKGYIDEVRVWDGARTESEIRETWHKRLDSEFAAENRAAVFRGWMQGHGRNNNAEDAEDLLPAELVLHYNFMTLPGAVNRSKVAKAAGGYAAAVEDAAMNDYLSNPDITTDGLYEAKAVKEGPEALNVGWWSKSEVRSRVYDYYRMVPWIKDTVAHLAPIDGTAADTFVYSDYFGGIYTHASAIGLEKYEFPNTANPYSYTVYYVDRAVRVASALRRATQYTATAMQTFAKRSQFQIRNSFVGTTDLLPLGGAFAKTAEKMWDGAASDAWELTGEDSDGDGLPDEWEEYAKANLTPQFGNDQALNWDTLVTYDGKVMKAGDLYRYLVHKGLQPGEDEPDARYAEAIDEDGDGIPDWWEKFYDVYAASGTDDSDGDGLCNYAEYLLSEVFDLGLIFDPTDARSVNGEDLDYFVRIGDVYAGEIFTDHDMIEDALEDTWGVPYATRYAWDAAGDRDEDGWSNFSEARYHDYTAGILAPHISHMLGDSEMKDMPIPTIELTVRYNGDQPLSATGGTQGGGQGGGGQNEQGDANSLAPLVVQTYTSDDLVVPDATFNVTPGGTLEGVKNLGLWENRTVAGTLAPGHIDPNSVQLEFMSFLQNDKYMWYLWDEDFTNPMLMGGTYDDYMSYYEAYGSYQTMYYDAAAGTTRPGRVQLVVSDSTWAQFQGEGAIKVTSDETLEKGYITYWGERVGTMNLVTGDYTLDLSPFETSSLSATNGTGGVQIRSSFIRILYTATLPKLNGNRFSVSLGEPTTGYVKEGPNTIVAFYDLDGNGAYTPGEPMGMAKGVDVGWNRGKVDIELTDTSAVMTRAVIGGATTSQDEAGAVSTDRVVVYGTEAGDVTELVVGQASAGRRERVRIIRTAVNGVGIQSMGIANTVVADKWLNLDQRNFLFEGDVMGEGEFDIDWANFGDEVRYAAGVDPTEVTYRIVLGNGSILPSTTNNLLGVATVRRFDTTAGRTVPVAVSPGSNDEVVYEASPTFRWSMPGNNNSYTAFRINVMSGSTVVWDSGVQRAPAREKGADGTLVYAWTAPIYVGAELANFTDYKWRVTMLNAKFQNPAWSAESTFRTNVPEQGARYAKLPVAVRYFGPSAVAANSTFVVEAFTTPDFSGQPVARAVVADRAKVTAEGAVHEANATLIGLAEGRYFVRAYADDLKRNSTTYGTTRERDTFESWGYACPRERSVSTPFTPEAFSVSAINGWADPVEVYIEDVDTNGNCVPDAYEYIRNGALGAVNADGTIDDTYAIAKALTDNLQDKVVSGAAAVGADTYVTRAFASPVMIALAAGAPNADTATVGPSGAIQVESEVESVEITSVAFDGEGNVVVEVSGKVEGESGDMGVVKVEPVPATVVCKVYRKASLDAAWGEPVAAETITVGGEPVAIKVPGADAPSAFFKVVAE